MSWCQADNTGAAEKEAAPLQSSPTSARSHGLEAWRSEDLKRAERLQAYATGQVRAARPLHDC